MNAPYISFPSLIDKSIYEEYKSQIDQAVYCITQ